MCEPTTIALAAGAVLSAGAAVYQGRQAAKDIEQQMAQQQKQVDAQAQQQTNSRIEEARRLRATARAAAAEAAVSGNSLFAIESDIEAQAGRDVALIETNRKNGIESTELDANARLRANRAEAIGGVLSAGVSAGSAYAQNYTIKKYGGS